MKSQELLRWIIQEKQHHTFGGGELTVNKIIEYLTEQVKKELQQPTATLPLVSDWISVEKDLPIQNGYVLVWQKNISDAESSRFQRAYYDDMGFTIYPHVRNGRFSKNKDFKNSDLEGDLCQITHWKVINPPKDQSQKQD